MCEGGPASDIIDHNEGVGPGQVAHYLVRCLEEQINISLKIVWLGQFVQVQHGKATYLHGGSIQQLEAGRRVVHQSIVLVHHL